MADPVAPHWRSESGRWVAVAVAMAVPGIPAGIAACVGLFHIDHAFTYGHMSAVQDLVAFTAVGVGLAGIAGGSVYLAVRLGQRPGAAITAEGVVAGNWRPV